MANEEHVKILKQGVDAWNQWRWDNPRVYPELERAELAGMKLQGISFTNANMREADLEGADLTGSFLGQSNLTSANLSYCELADSDISVANLNNVNLHHANLLRANLWMSNLSYANLSGANFNYGYMRNAIVAKTDSRNTNFERAMLGEADFTHTYLDDASFVQANLIGVNFARASFKKTNLFEARCSSTIFADIDLSTVVGLETIQHGSPSPLGIETLLKSGKLPEIFLCGCGIPKEVVDNLPYIINLPAIEYYSCFISYSTADEDFARLLKDTLYDAGINCWYAPEQILPGQRIDDEIERGIRYWDKVLFVCSKSSLTEKWWVDFEKDKALKKERDLQRERGEKVGILIPLNLDGYLFSSDFDTDAHRSIFEMRLVADFVGWKNDMDKFNREVQKVIRALRTDGGRTHPPKPKL